MLHHFHPYIQYELLAVELVVLVVVVLLVAELSIYYPKHLAE